MENPLYCLVCSSDLDKNTILINGEDGANNRKKSQFQLGLQLFCKLLKINENYVNQVFLSGERGQEEDYLFTGSPPCCKECWLTFEQMLQLQQTIELMQAKLIEHLDKLKAALKSSVPNDYEEDPLKIPADDIFGKIRDQLLSCVRSLNVSSSSSSNHQHSVERRKPHTKSSRQPNSAVLMKAKEYQPCSVILERLPLNLLEDSNVDIPIKQEIPTTFDDPTISSSDPKDKGGRSIRKSKLKALEFIENNTTLQKLDQDQDSCSDFNEDENEPAQDNHDDNDDEYPWELETKPVPEQLPNQLSSTSERIKRSKFSLISPDILLYQYTLIKVSQGYTHFTCQEPECPSPHISDASLNWNNLFQQTADHFIDFHGNPPLRYELGRKCPLCPTILTSGPKFRAHLIGTGKKREDHVHHIDTVACDICWKPIRNQSDAYRCHQWKHKNYQEKEQCPEGLPPTLLSHGLKNGKKKKNDNIIQKQSKLPKKRIPVKSNPQKLETSAEDPDNYSDFNEDEYASSPVTFSPAQDNLDNDEDENPWESEAKPIVEETSSNQISFQSESGRTSKFSLISPDILLYQYTLIKVSQGYTHFTCQEPECPSPHFSDGSLNWNNLFNQMADHINHFHGSPPPPSRYELGRQCPLCPTILVSGPKLRAHLIGTGKKREDHIHHIDKVACDICWKPIRNQSDAYRCHQWKHKNYMEKEQCPEELPPSLLSKAIKHGKVKKSDAIILKSSKLAKKRIPLKSNLKKNTRTFISPISLVTTTIKGTPKLTDHFSQILENSNESLLLYKYTLLKASYGISLSCQESNCDHITNGTDFTAFEHFKNHVQNCHPLKSDTSWKCPLCPEELPTGFSFRWHLLFNCSAALYTTHSNSFPFICTICWRPMSSASAMEYHQWLHKSDTEKESALNNKDKPPHRTVQIKEKERQMKLKCGYCQKEFKFVANLKAHEATHLKKEERKRYKCEQCPKLFLSPVAVRGHVEREHQRELMRKRTCPICGKEYNWRNGHSFRIHLRSHRDQRDFVCDVCGAAFLSGEALKRHKVKVHEQRDRRWQCEFCEMSYKENAHLNRHKRSAHKDKVGEEEMEEGNRLKYTCPEHRADFIGPKIQFPCPVCEKVFPLKSRMKKHWEKSCKNKKL